MPQPGHVLIPIAGAVPRVWRLSQPEDSICVREIYGSPQCLVARDLDDEARRGGQEPSQSDQTCSFPWLYKQLRTVLGFDVILFQRPRSCFACFLAALSCRDRAAVRTGLRVSQKGTDFVGYFGRENVLKFARLLLDFILVLNLQSLGEQTLGQAMPANHISGALPASGREFNDELPVLGGMRLRMNDFMATV